MTHSLTAGHSTMTVVKIALLQRDTRHIIKIRQKESTLTKEMSTTPDRTRVSSRKGHQIRIPARS